MYIVNYKYNLNENKVKKITSYLLTRYWCIWNKILQQEMTTPSWINLFKINSKGIRTTSTIFFFDIKSYSRINYTNCSWVFIGITLSNIYNEAFLWRKKSTVKSVHHFRKKAPLYVVNTLLHFIFWFPCDLLNCELKKKSWINPNHFSSNKFSLPF